jgi:hypothetical protein
MTTDLPKATAAATMLSSIHPAWAAEYSRPAELSRPAYVSPRVTTFDDAALLEALGPATAGGSYDIFGGP